MMCFTIWVIIPTVKIYKKDDEKSLSKRVLKIENLIYPKAVKKFVYFNLNP